MRYEIVISHFGPSAKNKGIIVGKTFHESLRKQGKGSILVVEAENDEQAFEIANREFCGNIWDASVARLRNRPLAGKSYMRGCRVKDIYADSPNPRELFPKYKVGDRVILHNSYRPNSTFGEHRRGVISEVVSDVHYSIHLDGYSNPYVDFSNREFALDRSNQ